MDEKLAAGEKERHIGKEDLEEIKPNKKIEIKRSEMISKDFTVTKQEKMLLHQERVILIVSSSSTYIQLI